MDESKGTDGATRNDLARMGQKLIGRMNRRFDGVDRRLDGMDKRFDGMDGTIHRMAVRLLGVEKGLAELKQTFDAKIGAVMTSPGVSRQDGQGAPIARAVTAPASFGGTCCAITSVESPISKAGPRAAPARDSLP